MLYQLSYERCYRLLFRLQRCCYTCAGGSKMLAKIPFTRNRTRDHLISAKVYSQMLYQLSYERCYRLLFRLQRCCYKGAAHTSPIFWALLDLSSS